MSNKDKKYLFSISKKENSIVFESIYKINFLSHIYYSEKNINDIKNNSKYFLLFDNIDEIYEELKYLISKDNCIIMEGNKEIILKIHLSTSKYKEFIITLPEEEKSIDELYSIIERQDIYYNKQLKELNNKIKEKDKFIVELDEIEITSISSDNKNDINNNIREKVEQKPGKCGVLYFD